MSIQNATPMTGRRARRILDQARNPDRISLHAARQFIALAAQYEGQPDGGDMRAANRAIICACRSAKRLYRGKNSYILAAPPWWIFYRDGTVVTVLHTKTDGHFNGGHRPPC